MRNNPSRYQPLADLLMTSQADEVVLTFKEVAAIIGRALPEVAILTTGWWTRPSHSHVALWKAAGWSARSDRDHLRVIFTHDAVEVADVKR